MQRGSEAKLFYASSVCHVSFEQEKDSECRTTAAPAGKRGHAALFINCISVVTEQ
jgi:hypothetical protein